MLSHNPLPVLIKVNPVWGPDGLLNINAQVFVCYNCELKWVPCSLSLAKHGIKLPVADSHLPVPIRTSRGSHRLSTKATQDQPSESTNQNRHHPYKSHGELAN